MSWDPNASYDNSAYGNYGNYSDGAAQQPAYGATTNPSGYGGNNPPGFDPYAAGQQGRAATPTYGRAPTPKQHLQQQTSFDMYNYDAYAQQPQQQAAAASSSFYNPNDYNGAQFLQPQQQQQPMMMPQQQQGRPAPQGRKPSLHPSSSSHYNPQQQSSSGFPIPGFGEQVNPMVANMAMQYGQDIVGKGQEELKRNLDKYVSIGQLKYYFAVDNLYVGKKLGLLLFPFTHSDWSIQYSAEEPVQPKYDLNAPDLYIPAMSYVTYVLVVGYILGLRNAFSPDLLATTASSALVWLLLEIGCVYLSLTVMSIATNLCKWDVLSFSAYKYVGMIAILLCGLVTQSRQAFYVAMAYVAGALAFFMVRTLKLRIEPEVHGMQVRGKRKLYMILFYAGLQPLLIWWMTSYFAPLAAIAMPVVGTVDVEE